MLRILSINAGLLQWKLGPWTVFENPKFVDDRAKRLPAVLQLESFDVLCVQECYQEAHFQGLANGMATTHPYCARIDSGGFRFHNGLAVFSRFVISEASLHPHRAVTPVERFLATKAMLSVLIEIPSIGTIAIINVHLSAGIRPTSDAVVAIRAKQIQELKTLACNISNEGATPLLAVGDFNCGPEAAPENYSGLVNCFNDAWTESGSGTTGYTWDTSNKLNTGGLHYGCAAQRCDHIFYSSTKLEVVDCRIACKNEMNLDSGVCTNISDHYGLLATFAMVAAYSTQAALE